MLERCCPAHSGPEIWRWVKAWAPRVEVMAIQVQLRVRMEADGLPSVEGALIRVTAPEATGWDGQWQPLLVSPDKRAPVFLSTASFPAHLVETPSPIPADGCGLAEIHRGLLPASLPILHRVLHKHLFIPPDNNANSQSAFSWLQLLIYACYSNAWRLSASTQLQVFLLLFCHHYK